MVGPNLKAYYENSDFSSDTNIPTNSGMLSKGFRYVEDTETNQKYNNCIDTYIIVYEKYVMEWVFKWGRMLQDPKHNDAGFVVLQIAISQIEEMEQCRLGKLSKKESGVLFCAGMKRIFKLNNDDDVWLKKFYLLCRCGLFHCGMTRKNVLVENSYEKAIEYKKDTTEFYLNPNKFLNAVIADFSEYINELKDEKNHELRKAFETKWDLEEENSEFILRS